jgi:SAM-dependent methyltransferase
MSPELSAREVCDFCGSAAQERVFDAPGFDAKGESFKLVRCQECSLVWVSPLPEPEALGEYYSADYYGAGEVKFNPILEGLVRFANRARAKQLIDKLDTASSAEPRRVLDIGQGRGNFLKAMKRQGFACVGTELASFDSADSEGITTLRGEVQNLDLEPGSFDAVTIWHVLEHVRKPREVIQTMARVLKPNGWAQIAVPYFGSTQAKVFGPNWFHLDLPRHLYHFTDSALLTELKRNGLEVRSVTTSALDQNLYGFVQSALNALLPKDRPNELYGLLKATRGRATGVARGLRLGLYLPTIAALTPLAVIEDVISSSLGKGGTLIVHAKKTGAS